MGVGYYGCCYGSLEGAVKLWKGMCRVLCRYVHTCPFEFSYPCIIKLQYFSWKYPKKRVSKAVSTCILRTLLPRNDSSMSVLHSSTINCQNLF